MELNYKNNKIKITGGVLQQTVHGFANYEKSVWVLCGGDGKKMELIKRAIGKMQQMVVCEEGPKSGIVHAGSSVEEKGGCRVRRVPGRHRRGDGGEGGVVSRVTIGDLTSFRKPRSFGEKEVAHQKDYTVWVVWGAQRVVQAITQFGTNVLSPPLDSNSVGVPTSSDLELER
jgi:hypothetical protein